MDHREVRLLNHAQQRRLEITLAHLEERLDRIANYLSDDENSRGILIERRNTISVDLRRHLWGDIARLREELREIAALFRLQPSLTDAREKIVGSLVTGWEMVIETKSRELRGYGALAPGLPERLDPRLDRIAAGLRRMLARLQVENGLTEGEEP